MNKLSKEQLEELWKKCEKKRSNIQNKYLIVCDGQKKSGYAIGFFNYKEKIDNVENYKIEWEESDDKEATYSIKYDGKNTNIYISCKIGSCGVPFAQIDKLELVDCRSKKGDQDYVIELLLYYEESAYVFGSRYNGQDDDDANANIWAFSNIGLSDKDLDAYSELLGDWVKGKIKSSTERQIMKTFEGVYNSFNLDEDIISKDEFIDEVNACKKHEIEIEECSELTKCYFYAVSLAKKGYKIFRGPFTADDEMIYYNVEKPENYINIVEYDEFADNLCFNYGDIEQDFNYNFEEDDKTHGVLVRVWFASKKRHYVYNCLLPVKIGDKVRVEGRLCDEIGEVVDIGGEINEESYMKYVEEIIL